LIWVAQNATSLDLEKFFPKAVLAIGQSKEA
jgi:hypothetical protein